jgi:hypothetical protein
MTEVLLLRLPRPAAVAVDRQHVLGEIEGANRQHQSIVPPHRQNRLGGPGPDHRRHCTPGIGGKGRPVQRGVIGVVEPGVDGGHLVGRHRPVEEGLVEQMNRAPVERPVGGGIDRIDPQLTERHVDGIDDDVEIVEQGAVPIPDDVPHGSSLSAGIDLRRTVDRPLRSTATLERYRRTDAPV